MMEVLAAWCAWVELVLGSKELHRMKRNEMFEEIDRYVEGG